MSRLGIKQVAGSTSGSVLFTDSNNSIVENKQKFYWDNSNFRLGINTDTPTESLVVEGNELLKGGLIFDSSVHTEVITDTISDVRFEVFSSSAGATDQYLNMDIFNARVNNNIYMDEFETGVNFRDKTFVASKYAMWVASGYTKNASNKHSIFGAVKGFAGAVNDPYEIYAEENTNTYTTSNANTVPVVLSGRSVTVNAGITNSVMLGGSDGLVDKSNYAFVNNLEIQNGIGLYTIDPTTNGAWGDRAIPDKKYVDSLTGTNGNTLSEVLANGNLSGTNFIEHNFESGITRKLGTGALQIVETIDTSFGNYLLSNNANNTDSWLYLDDWNTILGGGAAANESAGFYGISVNHNGGMVKLMADGNDLIEVQQSLILFRADDGGVLYQINTAPGINGHVGQWGTFNDQVLLDYYESPTTHLDWGDRSIPDKKYVDDIASGITPAVTETQVAFAGSNGLIGEAEFVYDTITNTLTVPNLVVSGTNTTINTETLTTTDPIISIGGGTNGGAPTVDDNKDRGIEFQYFDTTAKKGFFGFDDSTSRFTFIPDGTNTTEVFSGSKGDVDINDLYANSVIFNSINNEEVITNSDSIYSTYMGSATNNYEYYFLTDNNPGNPSGVHNGLYFDEGEIDIRFTPTGWVQDSQENSSALKISTYTYNVSNLGSIDMSLQKHQSGSDPAEWSNEIYIEDNTNTYTKNSTYHKQYPVLLSTNNTTVNAGVFNSVMLGGTNGIIDQDNTAFANELRFNSSVNTTVISDVNSNAKIYINSDGADDITIGGDASFSEPILYVSDNEIIITGGVDSGDFQYYIDNFGTYNNLRINFWDASGNQTDLLTAKDNRIATQTTTDADTLPVTLSTRNTTINSGIVNSVMLGGTDGIIDQSNTAFAQELRFNSAINETVLTSIGSSATLDMGNDISYAYTQLKLDTATADSWHYLDEQESSVYFKDKSDNYDGYTGITFNNYLGGQGVGRNWELYLNDTSDPIQSNRSLSMGGVLNRTTNITIASGHSSAGVVYIATTNTQIQSGFTNSVIMGGTNGVLDKSNYVFVSNFEIQNGIGQYTVQPSTNGDWGDLSIPTKKYVDDAISHIQSGSTTNATPLTLSNALTIDTDTVVAFETIIQGVQDNGDVWAYKFDGVIKNISATLTLVDWSSVGLGEDVSTSAFAVSITAGTTTLDIEVTGEAAKNINWKSVLTKNTIDI